MSERRTASGTTSAGEVRLDTGEPIRVAEEPNGRFHATADIVIHGRPIAHHAVGATAREAADRLRVYVAALRGGPVPATSLPPDAIGMPRTVCEIKGQGRVMQCAKSGGAWPGHIPVPPAVETRCTACDDYKAAVGVLAEVEARWAALERERGRAADEPPRSALSPGA